MHMQLHARCCCLGSRTGAHAGAPSARAVAPPPEAGPREAKGFVSLWNWVRGFGLNWKVERDHRSRCRRGLTTAIFRLHQLATVVRIVVLTSCSTALTAAPAIPVDPYVSVASFQFAHTISHTVV